VRVLFNRVGIMKKVLALVLGGVLVSQFCQAQDFWDKKTQDICQKVIVAIYDEILQTSPQYLELSEFNEKALTVDPGDGVYQISYQYRDLRIHRDNRPYEFFIEIGPLQDNLPSRLGFEAKHYKFPIIAVRASLFIHRYRRLHHYDLDEAVSRALSPLSIHQQEYFPFAVILKPIKDTFKVRERIEFEVIVKNKTNQNLKIKNLGEKTLFFTINGEEWGTKPSQASRTSREEYILAPYDSLSRSFKGNSFNSPGQVEIVCTYNLAYKGILPFGRAKIKIEE